VVATASKTFVRSWFCSITTYAEETPEGANFSGKPAASF
jgi:hypothetical protein